jgi:hypothetical protein
MRFRKICDGAVLADSADTMVRGVAFSPPVRVVEAGTGDADGC